MAKSGFDVIGLANVMAGLNDLVDMAETDKGYEVGTNVPYGGHLETGTSNMPPYPWLGPAIESVTSRGSSLLSQSDSPDAFIQLVATQIQRDAIVRLESRSVRPYYQTGNLAGNVEVVPI